MSTNHLHVFDWCRTQAAIYLIGTLVALAATLLVHAHASQSECDLRQPVPFEARVREQTDAALGALVRERRSSFAMNILVMDGAERFQRAYGYEDPSMQIPFSIDSTLIDLNSLRKLFTAVAIAQLVDRRVITSIDDPINRYLKHYRLPNAYGHEVTIREIATHSAGFDETQFGAGPLESDPAQFFSRRFPGYFENSGRFSSYDGYGPILLAYMVSELTNMPFNRYVEKSILRPLGMNDTQLAAGERPLVHRIVPFQPKSPNHYFVGEPLKPMDAPVPNGQAVSTGRDMAKFTAALVGSTVGQAVITQPMRNLLFTIHQSNGERGSAHGLLFEALRLGTTTIFTHGGGSPGLNCLMVLDPQREAGMFYCYGVVRTPFDRDPSLFPPKFELTMSAMLMAFTGCMVGEPAGYPPGVWNDEWNRYLGMYVSFNRHHHGFSMLRSMLHPNALRVERAGNSLRIDDQEGFVEIVPGTFGKRGALETFSFMMDPARGQWVLSGSLRPSAFERPALLEDPRILPAVLALLVFIAMSGLIVALLPHYEIDMRARLAVAAYGVVVACGVVVLYGMHAFGQSYWNGISWPLNILRVCAFTTIPACVALIVSSHRISHISGTGIARLGRWHYYLVSASSILMVLSLLGVHLISFSRIT